MPEITDADREQAERLLSMKTAEPFTVMSHEGMVNRLARHLADQRAALSTVDLYEEHGSIDVTYGTPAGIEENVPGLIAYTLTLPSGHVFRLAPGQARELMRETRLALGTDA